VATRFDPKGISSGQWYKYIEGITYNCNIEIAIVNIIKIPVMYFTQLASR